MGDGPGPSTSSRSAAASGKEKKEIDVITMEYCSLRIPYEELNVKFRNGQKELERMTVQVSKAAGLIKEKVANSKSPMEKAELKKNFDYLIKQVKDARKVLNSSCDNQLEQLELLGKRCDRLIEELSITEETSHREAERLERQRHMRYIVWHLIRCGYTKAARKIIEELHLEEMIDLDLFEKIHEIEQAILVKNTQPCLEWIDRHRSKLKKLGSRLEISVRQIAVVEMVEMGQIVEAVQYVKKYLTPIAKHKFQEELKKTMGMIACTLEESRERNPEMHQENRWEKLAEHYMKEVYSVYQWTSGTAFTALVQLGISVHKTPACKPSKLKPMRKIKCLVCRPDIWPIAEHLPFARVENSRILCCVSGELCDTDENFPFMLPSGHVIGKKAMAKLKRPDGKMFDPVHKKEMDENDALRLYFL